MVDTADLDRFLPYGSRSVFFALEMLGWGGFLSLASFFAAPVFTQGRLARWILVFFTAYGVFGITSVLGYVFGNSIVMVGFLAWGPVLGVAIFLLGLLFWQNYNAATKDMKGSQSSPIRT